MKRAPAALVTGARRGIGRGIAFALADAGFDVVVNDLVDDAATAETLATIRARGRRAHGGHAGGAAVAVQHRRRVPRRRWAAHQDALT
jgi:NAD(P)-dependent dehydrogenase (short-subunit alcohol dehydrogenase family)